MYRGKGKVGKENALWGSSFAATLNSGPRNVQQTKRSVWVSPLFELMDCLSESRHENLMKGWWTRFLKKKTDTATRFFGSKAKPTDVEC